MRSRRREVRSASREEEKNREHQADAELSPATRVQAHRQAFGTAKLRDLVPLRDVPGLVARDRVLRAARDRELRPDQALLVITALAARARESASVQTLVDVNRKVS